MSDVDLEQVMEQGRNKIEEKETEDFPKGFELTDEIFKDDQKFKRWLDHKWPSGHPFKKFLRKQRERTLEQMKKIENNELPSDYHKKSGGPPFDPDNDPHNGAYECPHGACESHNGRRTGYVEKKEKNTKGEDVTRIQLCKCHPGYKKHGPKR